MSTLKSKYVSAPVNGPTVEPLILQTNNIDRLTIDSSGNGTFGGTLDVTGGVSKLSTASGSAPSYSARAWVNFNGTGTVAIRASGNVSSITDNGTGDYTINFATAMPDANYSSFISQGNDASGNSGTRGANFLSTSTAPTTTATRVGTWLTTTGIRNAEDSAFVQCAIFR